MFFRGVHDWLKMIFYILAILGGIGNFTGTTFAGSSHSLRYPNLRNNEAIKARRGCASFGHSCYGGHGKRGGQFGHGSLIPGERPTPWDPSFPKSFKTSVERGPAPGDTVPFAPSIRGSPKWWKNGFLKKKLRTNESFSFFNTVALMKASEKPSITLKRCRIKDFSNSTP